MQHTPLIETAEPGGDETATTTTSPSAVAGGMEISVQFADGSELSVTQQELQLALLAMQTLLVAGVVYYQVTN